MAKQEKIKSLRLSLADTESILKWSHGEVTVAETVNYKTLQPTKGGLFDEVIFGPVKDYTCACGKYKSIKFRGKRCEVCGVEVIPSIVRRERMAHIKLVTPIVHTWYIRELPNPSKISLVLNMDRQIEDVIYFVHYMVINVPKNMEQYFQRKDVIDLTNPAYSRKHRATLRKILNNEILPKLAKDSIDYDRCVEYADKIRYTDLPFDIDELLHFLTRFTGIEFDIGASAILKLLKEVDIEAEIKSVKEQLKPNNPRFSKLVARLQVLKWFSESNNKPASMVLEVIPVTPPESRPLIQLETGNFTTSDINELYRKIIIRNDRLRKLIELDSPAILLNNEKRLLQEAVDSLFDNDSRSKPHASKDKQPLKSLSDILKGKTGLFRQNLLGKRVDYSARSVIVGGPDLKLYEVGIPVDIILKIFKPFILAELLRKQDDRGAEIIPLAANIKVAERLLVEQNNVIWPIVNEVIKQRPVLLNRAPTLHRLGIQAFEIKITDGKAIRLHPLVCSGFNADFDGDTMAVHLPISNEAVNEAREVMLSSKNIISPKDGKPIITPSIDMLTGIYYLTTEKLGEPGQGTIFSNYREVLRALDNKTVSVHTIVGISSNVYSQKNAEPNRIIVTSVGRIIFNAIFPSDFVYINDQNNLKALTAKDYLPVGIPLTDYLASYQVHEGLNKSNLSKIISALYVKYDYINVAKTADDIKRLGFQYATQSGISLSYFDLYDYTGKEQYIKEANTHVKALREQFADGELTDDERYIRVIEEWKNAVKKVDTDIKKYLADPKNADNPIIIMAKSGARGNSSQIVQMVGMRGLMAKTFDYGRNNETHIVRDTIEAPVTSSFRDGLKVYEFFNSSYGARKSMSDVQMKTSKAGYMTRKLVDAAQEVVVNDEDCGSTTGLVVSAIYSDDGRTVMEKLSERITGRYTTKPVVDANGHELIGANQLITKAIAEAIENAGVTAVEIRSIIHCQCKTGVCQKCYGIDLSTTKEVKLNTAVGIVAAQSIGEPITQINLRSFHGGGVAGGPQISQGYERINQLFEVVEPKEHETAHLSPINGRVTEIVDIEDDEHKIVNKRITIASDLETVNVLIDRRLPPLVKVGDQVNVGTKLNIGSIRLNDLLAVAGVESVRQYIISEVQRLYCNQGIGVNDKYIEIIVNQMTNRFKITNAGASDLNVGEYIVDNRLADINNALLAKNLAPANGIPLIIGLSNIPANSDSFLAAASFQYTKRALIKAAIKNQVDELKTLKENVMLGQLIPVGTGKMRRDDLNKLGLETYKDEY